MQPLLESFHLIVLDLDAQFTISFDSVQHVSEAGHLSLDSLGPSLFDVQAGRDAVDDASDLEKRHVERGEVVAL